MSRLKQLVGKLAGSRWFPTVTKPILAGAIAAGLTAALHALGVTGFVPKDVNAVAVALAGLLIGAVVQKPTKPITITVDGSKVAGAVQSVTIKKKAVIGPVVSPAEEKAEQQGFVG